MSKSISFFLLVLSSELLAPFLTSTKNSQNEKAGMFVSRKGAKTQRLLFAIFLRIIQTSMHFKLRGIRSPEVNKELAVKPLSNSLTIEPAKPSAWGILRLTFSNSRLTFNPSRACQQLCHVYSDTL